MPNGQTHDEDGHWNDPPRNIKGQTSIACERCGGEYGGGRGHGPGFCIERAPREMRGVGHEDTSWPSPPEKTPQENPPPGNALSPQENHQSRNDLALDDLHIVAPRRIAEAVVDYTITETWASKDGGRIMMRLEAAGLPSITLNMTCDQQPWIAALVDPVS